VQFYLEIPIENIHKRREENVKTKLRHQVTDENFNNAVNAFDEPTKSDNAITIKNDEEFQRYLTQLDL
jgi:hypothetical protein